jgi:hypothetical protein
MSLFPNSVYSSPGVLQADLNNFASPAPQLQYTADIPNVLVVSTLVASSTIQTSTLNTTQLITESLTASTISMPTGGTISGVSSIVGAGGLVNMNLAVLANTLAVQFGPNGVINGISSITAAGNTLAIPTSVSGVTNLSVSTINTNQVARATAFAQFATQTQSTFNTNSMVGGVAPAFTILNSNVLSTGHTYQMSFTGQVGMVSAIPGAPPAGDSFSWAINGGAAGGLVTLYQVPSTDVATQSAGLLSSVKESITGVFTADGNPLLLIGKYNAGTGTNYQYPSTAIAFSGPMTLLDLGVPRVAA